jgi:hypothetical protein
MCNDTELHCTQSISSNLKTKNSYLFITNAIYKNVVICICYGIKKEIHNSYVFKGTYY